METAINPSPSLSLSLSECLHAWKDHLRSSSLEDHRPCTCIECQLGAFSRKLDRAPSISTTPIGQSSEEGTNFPHHRALTGHSGQMCGETPGETPVPCSSVCVCALCNIPLRLLRELRDEDRPCDFDAVTPTGRVDLGGVVPVWCRQGHGPLCTRNCIDCLWLMWTSNRVIQKHGHAINGPLLHPRVFDTQRLDGPPLQ